jgi:hypothetical protein
MRYLLVDAHSVIFAWPELRALYSRRNALARDELVRRLTLFQDSSDYRVVAVFDGAGPKNSESSEAGGIQIFYSSSRQTADSVIERLTAKYGETHQLTVVTNDRMERQTTETFGAVSISVESFQRLFQEAQQNISSQLRKLKSSGRF